MAYVIAEPCIGVKDKACAEVCPCDCIDDKEGSPQMYIDPSVCIDCGACEVECPVEAIYHQDDLPQKWKPYIELNAAFYE